jgi:hypothetical protein
MIKVFPAVFAFTFDVPFNACIVQYAAIVVKLNAKKMEQLLYPNVSPALVYGQFLVEHRPEAHAVEGIGAYPIAMGAKPHELLERVLAFPTPYVSNDYGVFSGLVYVKLVFVYIVVEVKVRVFMESRWLFRELQPLVLRREKGTVDVARGRNSIVRQKSLHLGFPHGNASNLKKKPSAPFLNFSMIACPVEERIVRDGI